MSLGLCSLFTAMETQYRVIKGNVWTGGKCSTALIYHGAGVTWAMRRGMKSRDIMPESVLWAGKSGLWHTGGLIQSWTVSWTNAQMNKRLLNKNLKCLSSPNSYIGSSTSFCGNEGQRSNHSYERTHEVSTRWLHVCYINGNSVPPHDVQPNHPHPWTDCEYKDSMLLH